MLRFLTLTLAVGLNFAACKSPQPIPDQPTPDYDSSTADVEPKSIPQELVEPNEDIQNSQLELLDCRTDGCDPEESCVHRSEIDCTDFEGCKEQGFCSVIGADAYQQVGEYRCTDWLESVCGATKDSDCWGSKACKEKGFCKAGSYKSHYNKCNSENEEDCYELVTNVCMVTSDGCADSKECAERGNCGVQNMHWGSTCRPRDESHCQNSERCKIAGECGLVVESGSWCAPTLHTHCEASEACKTDGFCTMKNGFCAKESEEIPRGL